MSRATYTVRESGEDIRSILNIVSEGIRGQHGFLLSHASFNDVIRECDSNPILVGSLGRTSTIIVPVLFYVAPQNANIAYTANAAQEDGYISIFRTDNILTVDCTFTIEVEEPRQSSPFTAPIMPARAGDWNEVLRRIGEVGSSASSASRQLHGMCMAMRSLSNNKSDKANKTELLRDEGSIKFVKEHTHYFRLSKEETSDLQDRASKGDPSIYQRRQGVMPDAKYPTKNTCYDGIVSCRGWAEALRKRNAENTNITSFLVGVMLVRVWAVDEGTVFSNPIFGARVQYIRDEAELRRFDDIMDAEDPLYIMFDSREDALSEGLWVALHALHEVRALKK